MCICTDQHAKGQTTDCPQGIDRTNYLKQLLKPIPIKNACLKHHAFNYRMRKNACAQCLKQHAFNYRMTKNADAQCLKQHPSRLPFALVDSASALIKYIYGADLTYDHS